MNQQEQKRKRALIVFQIAIYGYLLVMFRNPALYVLCPRVVGPVTTTAGSDR